MNEKNIGMMINRLREEKGWTQKDLADKLNISDKAISKWETGTNLPTIDMIYKISTLFNVSFQKLLKIRLEDEHVDEKIINEIMDEFNETNKRKAKIIKIAFIILLVIAVLLVVVMIFTRSYNRFKVYRAYAETDNLAVNGVYVETRIKDKFLLNNIKIKERQIKSTDIISVDIFIKDDNKEKIVYTASDLNEVNFSDYQAYIKIDDLSDYFDNLYIKVIIVNNKNKVEEYEAKLDFKLDFSNNKVYDSEELALNNNTLTRDEIKKSLLDLKFDEINDDIVFKATKDFEIMYYYDENKLNYRFEDKNYSYRYTYFFDTQKLEVIIFDKNNIEKENYKYSIVDDKVLECVVGSCKGYDEALKVLHENILDELYGK